jgi:hypothetical protein
MDQKIFSQHILRFLSESFPEFISSLRYEKDDSFECKLRNPSGKFSMWIATYNSEITFGLESPTGEKDIHTHVSCYEPEDLEDCISTLKTFIDEVKDNKVILYKNHSNVYDWIECDRLLIKENHEGKRFEKIFWNET